MPEGPSIVILREQASMFKGRKVLEASGNTRLDLTRLKNKTVADFKSWGKHFLICFKGFTVRIHLLLFGSYRVNEKKETPPRLSLRFTNGELNFYTCSVKYIEGDLNAVYDWETDTMSPRWNPRKAKASLKKSGDALVCDVLLDQQIFSGCGNIMKNEILYRTRIHPLSTVQSLPPKKPGELVKEIRNYSHDFYKWKKKFELKKHWLAYRQKVCRRCNLPIIFDKLGKHKRYTYYCRNCQVLYS